MIDEATKKALNDNMWFIATCGEDGPHAVPVGFKCVTDDGKLAFGVCCLEKTMANYQANGKLAISVCAGACSMEITGSLEFQTEGPIYDAFVEMSEKAFKGKAPVKCAAVMTPEKGTYLAIADWSKGELTL